jgi:hypothetical protein
MAWYDRISGAAGNVLGGVIDLVSDVASETMRKARPKSSADGSPDLPAGLPEPATESPKSLFYDPFSVIDQLGYKDRPTNLTYGILASMAQRDPVMAAIMQTRVTQVANFSVPQENDREPGFRIVLRDTERSPTKKELNRSRDIEQWIQNTGSIEHQEKDTFEDFLKKVVRDTLRYDQLTFEIRDNRRGEPSDFYAVDASTIRIADVPPGTDLQDSDDTPRYVQVYDDVVISDFTARELCFGVRNPRTDIRVNGYGMSESEMLIRVITSMLFAFDYNAKFFSQGSAPKGLLNIRGHIPEDKLQEFRRHWYQQITGIANAWRTPILNGGTDSEMQYIDLHQSNRDMEYSAYMDWMIKVECGVFQMDPTEINFVYGNTGQAQAMFQAPAELRVKHSKDRGLRPLLRALATWINKYIVWRFDEEYQLVFTGLDPKTGSEIADLQKKHVTYLKTVDELRAEDDLPPMKDGAGECILDPTWLQFVQAKQQQEMMEQQGMEEGEGPEGEGPEGEEGPGGPPGEEEGGEEESPWASLMEQYGTIGGGEKGEGEETEKSFTYRIEV